MIKVFTVKNKELFEKHIHSKREIDDIVGDIKRAWVDCSDIDEEETRIISELLGVAASTLDGIEDGIIRPNYAKCLDETCPYYTWISTPVVEFKDDLTLHPLSIILKERFLITMRTKYSDKLIESTLRFFKVLAPAERKPTVILSKLVGEIIAENSGAMVSIRDLIDNIEAQAMEGPSQKSVTTSIFKLKRRLSTLHRLLWAEKELLSDLNLGVIPNLKLVPEAKLIIEDASDDITRELDFIDSFNNSLDSILRLQDLGSIHRVETKLVFLTVSLVVLTTILIVLEIAAKLAGA